MVRAKISSCLLPVAAAFVANGAMAAAVTLWYSAPSGTITEAYSGVFDGTAVLPSSYHVNTASYRFSFSDDKDPVTATQRTVATDKGSYRQVDYYPAATLPCSTPTDPYRTCTAPALYVYEANVTEHVEIAKTGQTERVGVSLGGYRTGLSGGTAVSEFSSVGEPVLSGRRFDTSYVAAGGTDLIGNYYPPIEHDYYSLVYVQTTTLIEDWTGDFNLAGGISQQGILDQLLNTRRLDFELSVTGDLYLTGAWLYLDITDTTPTGTVPEPGTFALLGLGIAALRLNRRRRTL